MMLRTTCTYMIHTFLEKKTCKYFYGYPVMHYENDNPHMPTAVQFAPTTCIDYRVYNKYMLTEIQSL